MIGQKPQQVLAYLSRYTHRVGITNSRLRHLDRTTRAVSFDYKDYADGARHKTMALDCVEFIRRFCLHVLPPQFVKIRHYGLLANRGRQQRLDRARALLGAAEPTGTELPVLKLSPHAEPLPVCPHCGWAALVLVRVIPPQRFRPVPSLTDTS